MNALRLAFCFAAIGSTAPTRPAERPNILLILVDDLGKEWLSCYGSEESQTPQIDRLAAAGVRFDCVYATPLCTPTRHEMLTGRYPFRTGWTTHHDTPRWGGQHLDPAREITFARLLRDAGYATAIAGKWQINDLRVDPDILRKHGFDCHCVWPGFEADSPRDVERYFDPFVQIDGRRPRMPEAFGPDVHVDYLIEFMRRHRDRPFLAYCPMVLVHTPFTKTPHNRDTSATGVALYPGMIAYMDHLVGRLVQALDELDLRDRTIVLFTSDNGAPGLRCRANGRVVTGGKGKLTEPGICVPFIVSGPGMVPQGQVSSALVDFTDILPTLVELAGAGLPPGVTIDGRSFARDLTGRGQPQRPREWIFSQLGTQRVIRNERYKLWSDGRFYDLKNDPLETRDLSQSADPVIAEARARLSGALRSLPPDARLPFAPCTQPAGARGTDR